jgi:protein TonB
MVGEAPKKPRAAWGVRRTLGWGWWALVLCNVIYHLATQNAHKEEGASRAPPSAYQASTTPPLTAEQSRQSFKQSFLPDRLSHAPSGDSSSLPYDHRSLLPYDKQAQLPTTMLDPANPPPTAEHSGLHITLDVPGAAGKPPGKLHLTVPPPAYPASARRKGEQGEVRVRVLINHEKKIIVTLAASSGHPDLDDAALRAARGMQLTGDAPPATGLTAVLPFAFALKP